MPRRVLTQENVRLAFELTARLGPLATYPLRRQAVLYYRKAFWPLLTEVEQASFLEVDARHCRARYEAVCGLIRERIFGVKDAVAKQDW